MTQTHAQASQLGGLSAPRLYGIMMVLLLAEVLSSFEQSMIIAAMPVVAREQQDLVGVGWLITAFLLAQAAVSAIGGRLGDLFGRRRVLLILVLLCGLGSLISAVAPTLPGMIAGRVLQGASGAILPLCLGIMRQSAPPGRAPFLIGILIGGYAFSAGVGYVLGGLFADAGHWRSIFWTNAIYAAPLVPLLLLVLPRDVTSAAVRRIDVLGAVLFAPAIALVLYGITRAQQWGWDSPTTWSLIGSGLLLLVLWVRHETRHSDPLINVRLLLRREIALANLSGALFAVGATQVAIIMMMLLQQPVMAGIGLGVSATMAAFLKLPSNVGSLIASPLSGFVAGRHGARIATLQAGLIAAAGWVCLIFFHDTVWQVVIGTVAVSFAGSMLMASLPNLVLEAAPLDRSSEATGMLSVVQRTFSAVGAQVAVMFLATSRISDPASGATYPSERAYQLAFVAYAITSVAITVICIAAGSRVKAAPEGTLEEIPFAKDALNAGDR
jgi:MFS family permease